MPRNTAPLSPKEKLTARIVSLTNDQRWSALAALPAVPTTVEEGIVRHALIEALEAAFPALPAWMSAFYEVPMDHPNWEVPYSVALLLAREELKL